MYGNIKCLLNKIRHSVKPRMLWFYSNAKNFLQVQVNSKNTNRCINPPEEVLTVMHGQFPASVIYWEVMSSKGNLITQHFFLQCTRAYAFFITRCYISGLLVLHGGSMLEAQAKISKLRPYLSWCRN